MTDEELRRLLKSAMPPTRDERPSRDLWPAVAGRVHERPPSSRLDIGLAIATVAALSVFPKVALLIAYHL